MKLIVYIITLLSLSYSFVFASKESVQVLKSTGTAVICESDRDDAKALKKLNKELAEYSSKEYAISVPSISRTPRGPLSGDSQRADACVTVTHTTGHKKI